jgi:alkylation response protein AidB-like acyl-CoA dehydrogenase
VEFDMPPEVEGFRRELRGWLRDNLTDDTVAAGRQGTSDEAAWATVRAWNRRLADAGWAAVAWPPAYGGRGAGALEQLVHAEETTRARAPLPVNVIGMNNIAPALMAYGTEEQCRTLLPRMARADDIWCQGMSEPEAGSDLASLRTRAVRDGGDYVVSGQKTWTSLGHRADWCQLFVRTDPDAPKHRGISCLVVDMGLPGIEARPIATLDGARDFAEVFFDDVRVPASALLGPEHGGWRVATTTLGHERAGAARLYTETWVQLEDLVADLLAEDGARGDAALERIGELALRTAYLEVLCRRAAAPGDADGGEVEAAALASASLAKTVWAELGQDLAAVAFDLLGPDGGGGRWATMRLRARSLTIAGGTTQVNKNVTAQRVLGLPRA